MLMAAGCPSIERIKNPRREPGNESGDFSEKAESNDAGKVWRNLISWRK
jgi:hypothetical protein